MPDIVQGLQQARKTGFPPTQTLELSEDEQLKKQS